MKEEYYIDEERGVVVVETSEVDPNGTPLFVEYTLDEWEDLTEK